MAGRVSDRALELIDARQRGSFMSVYGTDDPEIVWAFQDAARMPATSVRPRTSPMNHGPDSFTAESDRQGEVDSLPTKPRREGWWP
jgi:hypothetical protein